MQQKQKIYFPLKVSFQKQSESLTIKNLRDRKVIEGRKNIRILRREQENTEDILIKKKRQYEQQRQKIIFQSQRLKEQQKLFTEKLLKGQVKKDQILSQVYLNKTRIQRPQLFESKRKKDHMPESICPIVKGYLNILSKFIHGFAQQKIYQSAKKLGAIRTYYLLRRIAQRAELCFYLRPILKQNVGLYRLQFQKQKIMLSQRQKSQEQIVISVYNIEGKPNFHYQISYNPLKQDQQIEVPEDNPLKNLVILKTHNKMYTLKQYIRIFSTKFITNVKKLQFKIHMAKQRRNLVYFKVLSIDRFFQRKYCDLFFEKKNNISVKSIGLDILITVRRDNSANFITIETLKYSSDPNFIFTITQKLQPQLATKFDLATYFSKRIICLRKKACIKLIDYSLHTHQLIKIQSFVKKKIKSTEYNQKKEKGLLNMKFHRVYNQKSQILITGIIHQKQEKRRSKSDNNTYMKIIKKLSTEEENQTKQINQQKPFKVFFQCLALKDHVIIQQYPKKYWKLCKDIIWITNMNTVTEARDNFVHTISQSIQQYEQQQKKLQKLKPQQYRNRLRRFFINLSLKNRARKNIKFCKILKCSFGNFVLLIRKSQFYRDILNANLYKISSCQSFSTSQEKNQQGHYNIKIAQKFIAFAQKKEKPSYQTIYIFDDVIQGYTQYFKSFKNVQEEFYFDRQYFLLKPKKKIGQHYIERIVPIDIESEEIVKQFAAFELQNGVFHRTQKRKQSFMVSHQSIISSVSLPRQNQYRKYSYIIKQNAHRNVMYYSLLKDGNQRFFLDLFIVVATQERGDQQIQLIKRELLNKKDLMESNWSFIHSLVAKWVVNNCDLETQASQIAIVNKNTLGFSRAYNTISNSHSQNSILKDQIVSKTSLESQQ